MSSAIPGRSLQRHRAAPAVRSVIDTATNTVIGSPITVGTVPEGVAVTPDGSKV
jgi:hypothetical protein